MTRLTLQTLLGALVIGLFIVLLAMLGEQDYKTAIMEERTACLMVGAGHWPPETTEGYDCPERVSQTER